MEGPGATTNANALHKLGSRSTKTHIVEQFRSDFAFRFCTIIAAFIRPRRGLKRNINDLQGPLGKGEPAAAVQGRRA
eukprot:1390533-Pleurochrysis_carterae.AAC.1